MLTIEQLRAIMPQLRPDKGQALLPFLTAAIEEFGIGTPARLAAFLAQLAHESGQFRFMEELWGPTAAQRRYDPVSKLAEALGNTEPGDGKRFKGRGPIQITGRANYRRYGGLLGVDLVADPARAAAPEVGFRIAGLFWSKNGLNELADQASADAFRAITRRINGGTNGLPDRERFYQAARTVLGVTGPSVPRGGVPAPREVEEPAFERGHEAIRELGRRRQPVPGQSKTRGGAARRPSKVRARATPRKAKGTARAAAGAARRSKAPRRRRRSARNK